MRSKKNPPGEPGGFFNRTKRGLLLRGFFFRSIGSISSSSGIASSGGSVTSSSGGITSGGSSITGSVGGSSASSVYGGSGSITNGSSSIGSSGRSVTGGSGGVASSGSGGISSLGGVLGGVLSSITAAGGERSSKQSDQSEFVQLHVNLQGVKLSSTRSSPTTGLSLEVRAKNGRR